MEVTQSAALPLLGQFLQHSLQLLTYKLHETVLDVTVRNIDHEDEGGRVGRLVLLQESRQSTESNYTACTFDNQIKTLGNS